MSATYDELRGMTAFTPSMRQLFLDVAEAYYTDMIGDRLDRLVDALADVMRDDRLIGLGIEPSDDLVDEFFVHAKAVGLDPESQLTAYMRTCVW